MRRVAPWRIALFVIVFVVALYRGFTKGGLEQSQVPLSEARKTFTTHPMPAGGQRDPVDQPPSDKFRIAKYTASVGPLPAYITPDPKDGHKHPAIVWITGGDCNSIGDCWTPQPPDNDQTASAYAAAGLVMMFPSLRGGNQNPGSKEGFYGEVDDVIAAAKYLKKLPYVDANRVYIGGHSTGGTLTMLVAETTDMFRAAIAFGPVDDVSRYGADSGFVPVNLADKQEIRLRSPGYWLNSVKKPLWVIEGGTGNITSLRRMSGVNKNPNIHFIAVPAATHFSILGPVNALLAQKLAQDNGDPASLTITEAEVNAAYH